MTCPTNIGSTIVLCLGCAGAGDLKKWPMATDAANDCKNALSSSWNAGQGGGVLASVDVYAAKSNIILENIDYSYSQYYKVGY